MGTQQTTTMAYCPPNRGECWASYQYPSHWIATGYSKNKYFQWQCHTGKTEVSFEQWYHEVQCIKDHYPESMVWESIVRLLKGLVADMAQYMAPTASVAHILQKLGVIFGTVASFDVLMQNFYKVTQDNHKKILSFTMRLEGTLNQIRLQCPGRMMELGSNSISMTISFTESTSTSEIPSGISTAPLGPLTPS